VFPPKFCPNQSSSHLPFLMTLMICCDYFGAMGHIARSGQGPHHISCHFLLQAFGWLVRSIDMSCLLFFMLQKLVRVEVVVRSPAGWCRNTFAYNFVELTSYNSVSRVWPKWLKMTAKSQICRSQKVTNTPKSNLLYRRSYPPSEHHWEHCSDLRYKRLLDFVANLQLIF
jgi:hypothetical protein